MHFEQVGLPQTWQVPVAVSWACLGQNRAWVVPASAAGVGTDGGGAGAGAEAAPAMRIGCRTAVEAGVAATSCCWMIALAASVWSAPHAGQLTRTGIAPFTGSTSNAKRVSHGHWILIRMTTVWDSTASRLRVRRWAWSLGTGWIVSDRRKT